MLLNKDIQILEVDGEHFTVFTCQTCGEPILDGKMALLVAGSGRSDAYIVHKIDCYDDLLRDMDHLTGCFELSEAIRQLTANSGL